MATTTISQLPEAANLNNEDVFPVDQPSINASRKSSILKLVNFIKTHPQLLEVINDIVDDEKGRAEDEEQEIAGNLLNHQQDNNNPHGVTKAQVGLANVNNTSDQNKPVSAAQAEALALKADSADVVKKAYTLNGGDAPTYQMLKAVTWNIDASGHLTLRAWMRDLSGVITTDIEDDFVPPLASGTEDGVMPHETFATVEDLVTKVAALTGSVIPKGTIQLPTADVTDALLTAFVGGSPAQGWGVKDLDNVTWVYEAEDEEWVLWGDGEIAQATNDDDTDPENPVTGTLGLVKGKNTDGYVFVENDGTLSVVGWSALVIRVTNLENNKVNVSDIKDDLTSTDTDKPLSAAQGKALKDTADALAETVMSLGDNKQDTLTTEQLDAVDSGITAKLVEEYGAKLDGVAHDDTLEGDGTAEDPLSVVGGSGATPTLWLVQAKLIGPKNAVVPDIDTGSFSSPFPATEGDPLVGDRAIDLGGHTGTITAFVSGHYSVTIDGFRGQESATVTIFDWDSLSALHIMPGLTRLVQSASEEYWVYNYENTAFFGFGVVLEGTSLNLVPRLNTFIITANADVQQGYVKQTDVIPITEGGTGATTLADAETNGFVTSIGGSTALVIDVHNQADINAIPRYLKGNLTINVAADYADDTCVITGFFSVGGTATLLYINFKNTTVINAYIVNCHTYRIYVSGNGNSTARNIGTLNVNNCSLIQLGNDTSTLGLWVYTLNINASIAYLTGYLKAESVLFVTLCSVVYIATANVTAPNISRVSEGAILTLAAAATGITSTPNNLGGTIIDLRTGNPVETFLRKGALAYSAGPTVSVSIANLASWLSTNLNGRTIADGTLVTINVTPDPLFTGGSIYVSNIVGFANVRINFAAIAATWNNSCILYINNCDAFVSIRNLQSDGTSEVFISIGDSYAELYNVKAYAFELRRATAILSQGSIFTDGDCSSYGISDLVLGEGNNQLNFLDNEQDSLLSVIVAASFTGSNLPDYNNPNAMRLYDLRSPAPAPTVYYKHNLVIAGTDADGNTVALKVSFTSTSNTPVTSWATLPTGSVYAATGYIMVSGEGTAYAMSVDYSNATYSNNFVYCFLQGGSLFQYGTGQYAVGPTFTDTVTAL
jgi:hypothetical protein